MPAHQPFSNRTSEPVARGSSLHTIKTQQRAKEEEDKIKQRRKKGIVVMMLQFLQEQGYMRSLEALQGESQLSLQRVAPADNVDMWSIFTEFEDYYEFRFGKLPRFYRAEGDGSSCHQDTSAFGEMERSRPSPSNAAASRSGPATPPEVPQPPAAQCNNTGRPAAAKGAQNGTVTTGSNKGIANANTDTAQLGSLSDAPMIGKSIKLRRPGEDSGEASTADETGLVLGRQLKPMPRYPTAELNDLAMTIQRDILDANPNVCWSDIAELDHAKMLLKEAVVMPVKYPQLFQGIVRPWKGILLFGPPGTGKTMLAKALATECRTTFFNISASSIVSKWRGDSEKLVRMLFELAVHYAPSTIFIDELDSLMSARASDGSEHEGSRRMKTELLVQMDGLQRRPGGDVVFVLAASNVPWDLDGAMLRRLEKRVMVGLPSAAARRKLLIKLLGEAADPAINFEHVADALDGHSGADIDVVCREALMRPIRALIHKLETTSNANDLSKTPLARPKVTAEDLLASIACTKASNHSMPMSRYTQWEKQFGSGISVGF